MSAICIVDHTSGMSTIDFEKYNMMAKEVIGYCLKNDLAAFFNSYDYGKEVIESVGMDQFFLLSDSFLYKNCEFLDTTGCGIYGSEKNLHFSIEQFKLDFLARFSFFKDIVDILNGYGIDAIDIYLDESGGAESFTDFDTLPVDYDDFLEKLCEYIISNAATYSYCFPAVKLELRR